MEQDLLTSLKERIETLRAADIRYSEAIARKDVYGVSLAASVVKDSERLLGRLFYKIVAGEGLAVALAALQARETSDSNET